MSCGGGSPRRTMPRAPSANTHSSASTHGRIDPCRSECGPAALVPAIPPTVQNSPLDGSTGNRRPTARAWRSSSPRNTPTSTRIDRVSASGSMNPRSLLRSSTTPSPIAPPAMPLPDPRGTIANPWSRAHLTITATSLSFRGTAIARGCIRAIPAASEYTARASSSVLKSPEKPAGAR